MPGNTPSGPDTRLGLPKSNKQAKTFSAVNPAFVRRIVRPGSDSRVSPLTAGAETEAADLHPAGPETKGEKTGEGVQWPRMRRLGLWIIGLGIGVVWPARAMAQTDPGAGSPPPAATPPSQPPPPPGAAGQPPAPPAAPGQPPSPYPYGYPQQGYPPYGYPPGYAPYPYPYPYAQPRPPATKPYVDGQPVPQGYHLEEHSKRGLVIAGTIVFAIPYTIGLSVVGGEGFPNATGFLVLPAAGPWITLAARHNTCPNDTTNSGYYYNCSDDDSARSLLIFDGLAQTTGAVLLIAGIASTTKQLVRDDALLVVPTRVGSGYGLTAAGLF